VAGHQGDVGKFAGEGRGIGMYDWKGQWIERDDDDPPERLRCQKGHFLPHTPTDIQVWNEATQWPDVIPYEQLTTIANKKDIMDYIWLCKCGWTQKD